MTDARVREIEDKLSERLEFIADCDRALDAMNAPTENEGVPGKVSTWRRIELVGKLLWGYRQQLEEMSKALRRAQAEVRVWKRRAEFALDNCRVNDLPGNHPLTWPDPTDAEIDAEVAAEREGRHEAV